jgi:PD-(D/E)XK nuclease superfamily protein
VEHPKDIGDRSTLAIIFALRIQGHSVFVPFGENTRCDLVVDRGGQLSRVQCKTGRLRNGAIVFNTCSSYAHHPNPKVVRRDYAGQINEFAVFCPETQGVYCIPIEEMPTKVHGRLRVTETRNNQRSGIRYAAQYEIAKIDVY